MKNQQDANAITYGIARYFASVARIKLFLNILIWMGILTGLGYFMNHPLNVPVDQPQINLLKS
jgi:hypothetical protein